MALFCSFKKTFLAAYGAFECSFSAKMQTYGNLIPLWSEYCMTRGTDIRSSY